MDQKIAYFMKMPAVMIESDHFADIDQEDDHDENDEDKIWHMITFNSRVHSIIYKIKFSLVIAVLSLLHIKSRYHLRFPPKRVHTSDH